MLYRNAGASVLCLQEVQSGDVAVRLAGEMRMDCVYREGALYPQYGAMIATRLGAPLRLPNREPSVLERSLVAATVPLASGTLGVACIHLTSGRQSSALEARAARVREISEFLALHGAAVDVLAGDFNEDPDGEVAALLRANGFLDAASLCGMETLATLAAGTKRRDLIWIKARWKSRLTGYGVIEELAVNDLEGVRFLSDHRPLWITLDA